MCGIRNVESPHTNVVPATHSAENESMISATVAALAYAPALTPTVTTLSRSLAAKMTEEAVEAPTPATSTPAGTPSASLTQSIGNALQEGPEVPWASNSAISDRAGMMVLADRLNPVVGFWGARCP